MDLFSDSESESSSVFSSRRSGSPIVDIIEQERAGNDNAASFRINREYASRFQHNNERAELQRLQDKHGHDAAAEEDSSESESEDENGEQMTADVDAAILTTLAKIRRKDESIYDVSKRVFDEERTLATNKSSLPRSARTLKGKKGEAVTLGQYQRERIQDLLATSEDPAKDLADATMIERNRDEVDCDEGKRRKTYADEEEALRREVTSAFHEMADDPAELFTRRERGDPTIDDTSDEIYRRYLLHVMGGNEAEIRALLRTQSDEAADNSQASGSQQVTDVAVNKTRKERQDEDDETFLANYILDRGWLEKDNKSTHAQAKTLGSSNPFNGTGVDELDDDFDSRAEAFESAYNYRFQDLEEGKIDPQIQSYSRRIEGSARREDNKRKKDREERKRRKAAEQEEKRAELDRLRSLKRKSISERLAKLKEITGSAAIDLDGFELDDDFDPVKHDKAMAAAFDDRYYGDTSHDRKKPVFDGEDEELDSHERYTSGVGDHMLQDEHFDKEHVHGGAVVNIKLSKAEKKKLKKREKAAQARQVSTADEGVTMEEMNNEAENLQAADEMARLDPSERKRKVDQMMDEYYGLDYEDVVADQPTRFRYTEVPKSDFGLSATEILLADDAELNKVVGIKRLQPYRRGNGKKGPADLKTRLNEFRRNFEGKKINQNGDGHNDGGERKVKKAGKRERERKKAAAAKAQAE